MASSTTPQIRYQWQFNGDNIPGATGSSFTNFGVQLDDTGDYRVLVIDDIATEVSDIAHVNVLVDPTVVRHPQSQIVAVGQEVSLSVEVTNIATLPIDFLLRKNNGVRVSDLLLNQRAQTNTFTNISLIQAAAYFYAVTNAARAAALVSSTVNRQRMNTDKPDGGLLDWKTPIRLIRWKSAAGSDLLPPPPGIK